MAGIKLRDCSMAHKRQSTHLHSLLEWEINRRRSPTYTAATSTCRNSYVHDANPIKWIFRQVIILSDGTRRMNIYNKLIEAVNSWAKVRISKPSHALTWPLLCKNIFLPIYSLS